jgi:hypothetical protein
MTVSFFAQFGESTIPIVTVADAAVGNGSPDGVTAVGQIRLSDSAREAAIELAKKALERHYSTWEKTGCFSAKGMADRARLSMEALIRGRSAEYVAELERERGLA